MDGVPQSDMGEESDWDGGEGMEEPFQQKKPTVMRLLRFGKPGEIS